MVKTKDHALAQNWVDEFYVDAYADLEDIAEPDHAPQKAYCVATKTWYVRMPGGSWAVSDDSAAKMEEAATYLNVLAHGWTVEDWGALKRLLDSGLAENEYQVGSQIEDTWYKDANTSYTAAWDIVHYDDDGNMYLKWHYAFPDNIPFDEPEAIYYADGTEAAGSYYITIGAAYGNGWVANANIQITTTVAMDEGDQLCIECSKNYANDPTSGLTWNLYAKGSTTSKDSGTTSSGTSGTCLGTTATDAQKTNGRINAPARVVYGSGRWSESAIRQWLNSEAAAGSWWSAQNGWDRPPAVAATLQGFLAGCSQDFLDILEEVDVVTALNTKEGFSDTTETTRDRIFLPSLQEMYVTTQLADVEGEDWDYYKELAASIPITGRFPTGTAYDELKTYSISNQTSAVYVWLRSCLRYTASSAWFVSSTGYVTGNGAYYANRGCPACIIKKSA